MHLSDLPGRIPLPFADSGGKTTIPVTTASPGRASLTAGFPPETRQPISAGGIPPDGTDMNGILFETSAWSRWQSAGGQVTYDATFSTDVGGYPRGTVLLSNAQGQWYSLVNDNTTNPNSGGADWMNLIPLVTSISATGSLTALQQGVINVNATAGNITLTLPAIVTAATIPLRYTLVRTDTTGNTVTIARAAANTIEGLTSIPLPVGGRLTLQSNGSATWYVVSSLGTAAIQAFTSSGTFTVPAGVRQVRVICTGGGGGGAGGDSAHCGSGGGAGGTAIGVVPVTPGASVTITVGSGGGTAAGAAPATGGGTSSFGIHLSATGGQAGTAVSGSNNPGGGGGAGAGGVNINGGYGTDAYYISAGTQTGGVGGCSYWGGGGRAAVNGSGPTNMDGQASGSGGGGAYFNSGTTGGGNGAAGVVLVEWN